MHGPAGHRCKVPVLKKRTALWGRSPGQVAQRGTKGPFLSEMPSAGCKDFVEARAWGV